MPTPLVARVGISLLGPLLWSSLFVIQAALQIALQGHGTAALTTALCRRFRVCRASKFSAKLPL
jgi:hypothetical protein